MQAGKTPQDVKSIAVDFRGFTLLQGKYIRIYVTMDAGQDSQVKGKIAVNTFYYTFYEINGTFNKGESNAVNVTVFKPIATIGDILFFDKNNNSIYDSAQGEVGISNATVELYIKVDKEDENTIIYNGYILKKVATTKTGSTGSSIGKYSFKIDISGIYFVKFINPNLNVYGLFSKKMSNYDESIQISQVDENGFTDPIIIDFEANGNKDINYLFADAGVIPKQIGNNFEKISDVPKEENVELGSNTTFSIYDVANKNTDYSLEHFVLEDVPHKGLNFKSITIPAYANSDIVKYTVKYKLKSSNVIQIIPGGEDLSASVQNKIDFIISVQPNDHVDIIYVDFGTVPAGFKPLNDAPIVIEFTLSNDIGIFNDIIGDLEHKLADNTAYLKYILNNNETRFQDVDNIIIPVPEENAFKKESDVPKGEYLELGGVTTFSIYEVENKNTEYSLRNFILEDIPHKGLNFKSITIPAYEMGD